MFALPVLITISFIMLFIQISIWNIFPAKVRDILFSNPALAFIVNLAGSSLIVMFTGVASFVGSCNLIASVLFGVYAYIYKRHKGIEGLEVKWNFIIPRLDVKYNKQMIK